jgi:hypothetical protein
MKARQVANKYVKKDHHQGSNSVPKNISNGAFLNLLARIIRNAI